MCGKGVVYGRVSCVCVGAWGGGGGECACGGDVVCVEGELCVCVWGCCVGGGELCVEGGGVVWGVSCVCVCVGGVRGGELCVWGGGCVGRR